MHTTTLITRPARAAVLVAIVGLLFGAQGAVALRWRAADGTGTSGYTANALLLAALAATIIALGVLVPLHSRRGAIGATIARCGLAIALLPVVASLAFGCAAWSPLVVAGLCVAAVGMALLASARRHEGDLPGRLLELMLAGTVLGVLLAPLGGCVLAGASWPAVAAVLWGSYVSPIGRVPLHG